MEALSVKNLTKNFGKLEVLQNVSFSVGENERRVFIIGPNGCGKTTLFNVITGELPPSAGKVFLFSKDITRTSVCHRAQLGLGRTFQITDLFPNFTVMDNALLALQAHQTCRYQTFRPLTAYSHLYTKAETLLRSMNLWEKRVSPVNALSHGEMRQVELILGLAMEPKVMLLDEPTAGLTSSEAQSLAEMIRDLLQDVTTVIVEHDMPIAFSLAERIIVLHDGGIIADGPPEEIKENSKVRKVYLGEEAGV